MKKIKMLLLSHHGGLLAQPVIVIVQRFMENNLMLFFGRVYTKLMRCMFPEGASQFLGDLVAALNQRSAVVKLNLFPIFGIH